MPSTPLPRSALLPVFLLSLLLAPSGTGEQAGAPAGPAGGTGEGAFADVGSAAAAAQRHRSGARFGPVAGLSTAVEVPAGTATTVIATFSARPRCAGAGGGRCLVRISVDGRTMGPAAESDSVFDAAGEGEGAGGATNAIVRSLSDIGPGRHEVAVEAAVAAGGGRDPLPILSLSDSSLIAQAVRQ